MSLLQAFIGFFGNAKAFHSGRLDAEDFYEAWNSVSFSSTLDYASFVFIGNYTTQNLFET